MGVPKMPETGNRKEKSIFFWKEKSAKAFGQKNNVNYSETGFSEKEYRTIKFRKVVSLPCRLGKDCKGGRKKESPEISELFTLVPKTGIIQA